MLNITERHPLRLTMKDDRPTAHVEQKNGDMVRKTIGYARFRSDSALSVLSC
jgi:hypothetical protein